MTQHAKAYGPRDITPAEAYGKASRSRVGILRRDVDQVISDFAVFTHPSSRARYADKWITLVAGRFEETWQVFYQLLKTIEEEHLYRDGSMLEGKQAFPTFQAYWEKKTGKSFDQWFELEQTYKYVCVFKPELLKGLYEMAKQAKRRQENVEDDARAKQVGPKHLHIPLDSDINEKDVTIREYDDRGNARTYALRRLAKDRPDLHAQCLEGTLTANAAMVQAGFRTKAPSRRKTALERLRAYWRKVSPGDRALFLAEVQAAD